MKTAIIYSSETGFTKKYALWLEEKLGSDAKAYSLKEAALLFESGSYKTLDYTLLVVAPLDLRIQRVRARDQATEEQVRARIDKQMPDAEKEKLADFIIVNDGVQALLPQVLHIHNTLIKA